MILARRVIVVITMKGMRDGGESDGAALILECCENVGSWGRFDFCDKRNSGSEVRERERRVE